MKLVAVLRAAQILRAQPAYTMPLAKLHARLAEELGPDAGTYAQVYLQLKNRPHSFMLVDSPRLLEGGSWPAEVREDYGAALEGTGLGACVRVALTEFPGEETQPDAIAVAAATMNELRMAAGDDPVIREYVARAARELEEISAQLAADAGAGPPTTPPPDLRQ